MICTKSCYNDANEMVKQLGVKAYTSNNLTPRRIILQGTVTSCSKLWCHCDDYVNTAGKQQPSFCA